MSSVKEHQGMPRQPTESFLVVLFVTLSFSLKPTKCSFDLVKKKNAGFVTLVFDSYKKEKLIHTISHILGGKINFWTRPLKALRDGERNKDGQRTKEMD